MPKSKPFHLSAKEFVRHLNQHARAVARLRIGALCAAMLQAAERLNAALQYRMRSRALDIGDKPHPAGIVFKARVI